MLLGVSLAASELLFPGDIQGFSSGTYRTCDDPLMCDLDQDGLADVVEAWLGTDPKLFDTDGDGMPDGREVAQGTSPLIPEAPRPPVSSVKIDFIPEQGAIRVAATVCSATCFRPDSKIEVLLGWVEGEDVHIENRTQQFVAIGRISRSCDQVTRGYISSPIPVSTLARRFSIAVVLREAAGLVFDEALVGTRLNSFYRTELVDQGDDVFLGSTVFISDVTNEGGGTEGFVHDEDCKQTFNRVGPTVKVISKELCVAQQDRFCPSDCGMDVGKRVVCIGSYLTQ